MDIDIALPSGQCAQRFFVRRIYRYAEFVFHLMDGGERQGYVTAMDDQTIQISTSDEEQPKAVLIPWSAVVDIEETGTDLSDKFPGSEFQKDIKSYTRALRLQAEFALSGGKKGSVRLPVEGPIGG